jgi:hypothetical protein
MYCNGTTGLATFDAGTATCNTDPAGGVMNECYYRLNDARQWVLWYQDCTFGNCPATNSLNPAGIPTGQVMGPYRSCG